MSRIRWSSRIISSYLYICGSILQTTSSESVSTTKPITKTTEINGHVLVTLQTARMDMGMDTPVIVHFTCFQNDGASFLDREPLKSACCRKIVQATKDICSSTNSDSDSDSLLDSKICQQMTSLSSSNEDVGDSDHSIEIPKIKKQCSDLITEVPLLSSMQFKNGEKATSSSQPGEEAAMFYFSLPYHDAETDGEHRKEGNRHSNEKESLSSKSMVQFHFNFDTGQRSQYDDAQSPFQLREYVQKNEKGNEKEVSVTSMAYLRSTVSQDGGMHRAFSHQMKLLIHTANFNEVTMKQQQHPEISGTAYIILPLSQGFFLDLDDAFRLFDDGRSICRSEVRLKDTNDYDRVGVDARRNGHNCHVTIETLPGTLIDIEQPAFASPQHVVVLRFEFQFNFSDLMTSSTSTINLVDSGSQSALEVEVDFEAVMNLHFRYPQTNKIGSMEIGMPTYLPTPFLYRVILESPNPNFCGEVNVNTSAFASGPMILIGAGYDGHHDFVMSFTLIVSLFGAWCMLKGMSTVSVWS